MKPLLVPSVLLACLLFCSCNTTKKLYEAKEYDQVIMKTAPKICSGRLRSDEIFWVANAYHEANQADHERIQQLKSTGSPDVWPEIHERYLSMKGREDALSCFPKALQQEIHYQPLNLDDELTASGNKAEAYLSAKIKQLVETGEPSNIQEAKKLLCSLMRINPDSPHIGEYRLMAMLRQTALLEADLNYNDRRRPLPEGIDEAIMHFDETELAQFHLNKDNPLISTMVVRLTDFTVTPNHDETATFKETHDGLTATVTDHVLSKSATVKADLVFYYEDPENVTGETWNTFVIRDLAATSLFQYSYTTVEGPQEACSAQTLERMKQQPLPFPTDVSILRDAALKLNDLIAQQLSK